MLRATAWPLFVLSLGVFCACASRGSEAVRAGADADPRTTVFITREQIRFGTWGLDLEEGATPDSALVDGAQIGELRPLLEEVKRSAGPKPTLTIHALEGVTMGSVSYVLFTAYKSGLQPVRLRIDDEPQAIEIRAAVGPTPRNLVVVRYADVFRIIVDSVPRDTDSIEELVQEIRLIDATSPLPADVTLATSSNALADHVYELGTAVLDVHPGARLWWAPTL